MSNYSFDSELAWRAISHISLGGSILHGDEKSLSLKKECKLSRCISAPIQQCSWGGPPSRSGSLNQLPLQCPQTQIPFLCVTLDKSYSLSFYAVCLSVLKLLLICLIWSLAISHFVKQHRAAAGVGHLPQVCVCVCVSQFKFWLFLPSHHKLNSPVSSLKKKHIWWVKGIHKGVAAENKVGYRYKMICFFMNAPCQCLRLDSVYHCAFAFYYWLWKSVFRC